LTKKKRLKHISPKAALERPALPKEKKTPPPSSRTSGVKKK